MVTLKYRNSESICVHLIFVGYNNKFLKTRNNYIVILEEGMKEFLQQLAPKYFYIRDSHEHKK